MNKLLTCRPSTVNRDAARFRNMLFKAVEWEVLEASPMKGLRFLRESNERTRYLSLEECERLIRSCVANHVRAVVTTALHTGMRLGELLNLRWQDLDFSAGMILISDSKNGQARHVPMDATVSALFRVYPRRPDTELVFSSATGDRLRNIRTGFSNARRRAGLSDLHFHDLRHTFSSHFIMSGGDLYILKEILGHKSITMTQRYAHLSHAYRARAIDRMNNFWQGIIPAAATSEAIPKGPHVTAASQTTLNHNSALGEIL